MGRLRIRNPDNSKWLDICQTEWYVRNSSNTAWQRMTPKQGLKARHGSNDYWIDIDCKSENDTGDDCAEDDEYGGTPDGTGANGTGPGNDTGSGGGGSGDGSDGGSGGGSGNDSSGGSGNGPGTANYNNDDLGSGDGKGGNTGGYQDNAPYPAGYDLPDSDGDGAGLRGDCLYRPGLNECEPYLKPTARPDMNCGTSTAGSFNCPFVCPDSASGRGKGIWEFYVELGSVSGNVTWPWSSTGGSTSFDVYYRGQLIASTNGRRSGRDTLSFVFTPTDGQKLLFVRARSKDAGTRWNLQIKCPGDNDADGTINNPRPCLGTFEAKQTGGQGTYEYYHDMGAKAGEVDIHYQMWNQPDRMDVFNEWGDLISSTNAYVAGEGHLIFNYTPTGGTNQIRVRITARDPGTSWIYLISCPGATGTERKPRPCTDGSTVTSGGAGITDTWIDFGSTGGRAGIRYQMYQIADKLDVYQNGTLLATTGYATGDHWLYFNYDPSKGTKLQVRVTGPGKTSWSFLHTCPRNDLSTFSINNPSVKEGNGEAVTLDFYVTISEAQSVEQSVDYATSNGSGVANVDYRPMSGKLIFPAGSTSQVIRVPVIGNTTKQGNRTVNVNLSNPTGKLNNSIGTGIIIDDDSTLCNQNPQQAVHESTGGPNGGMVLYVQDSMDCAAGNTMYLMQAYITFANNGPHVFNFVNDDDFEFYIDCQKVAEGPIGSKTVTIDVIAGTRNLILRYKNVPDCTPGYAGFSVLYNNQVVYVTRAADWKGQPNSIGEIG